MASGALGPALPSYWRSFVLYCLSHEFCSRLCGSPPFRANGKAEDPVAWSQGHRTADLTQELQPDEVDVFGFKELCWWLLSSINPIPPPGMRHYAHPKSGALAQNRTLLLAHMMSVGTLDPKTSEALTHAPSAAGLFGARSLGYSPSLQLRTPRAQDDGEDEVHTRSGRHCGIDIAETVPELTAASVPDAVYAISGKSAFAMPEVQMSSQKP